MEESRTKNTLRNVKTGAIVQLVNKIMGFVVRTVFIKILNSEYLGVNGLFTNILTLLSFAELGIGTAIIFNMYKPVAEDDKEKIKSLMKLYRKSYNTIGFIVFLLGLCIIPFMKYIVKDVPNIKENIVVIYILFLLNTSSSYFFTYKKSIIAAHQKQSIIDNIDSIFYLIKSIVEIIFLVLTKDYIVYLLIQIIGTFFENIILSKKSDKMYPYLKEKNIKPLSKEETNSIFANVKSLVVYKFGAAIMNGTDNVLIAALIGTSMVGYCSNYVMIINSVKSILLSGLKGITASVGNLNAVGKREQKEKIFYQITFVNYIIYSFCAISFMVLLNPFIKLWLGKSEYVLSLSVSVALAVCFFIEGLRNPGHTYRTTLGLFEKGKAAPYIGAITNIIFSVCLCNFWGVTGIYIATSIAQIVSYFWIDPYLVHKYEFKTPIKKYIEKTAKYFVIFAINSLLCFGILNFVTIDGIIGFGIRCIVVIIVPNLVNLICFYKSDEFIELKKKLLRKNNE